IRRTGSSGCRPASGTPCSAPSSAAQLRRFWRRTRSGRSWHPGSQSAAYPHRSARRRACRCADRYEPPAPPAAARPRPRARPPAPARVPTRARRAEPGGCGATSGTESLRPPPPTRSVGSPSRSSHLPRSLVHFSIKNALVGPPVTELALAWHVVVDHETLHPVVDLGRHRHAMDRLLGIAQVGGIEVLGIVEAHRDLQRPQLPAILAGDHEHGGGSRVHVVGVAVDAGLMQPQMESHPHVEIAFRAGAHLQLANLVAGEALPHNDALHLPLLPFRQPGKARDDDRHGQHRIVTPFILSEAGLHHAFLHCTGSALLTLGLATSMPRKSRLARREAGRKTGNAQPQTGAFCPPPQAKMCQSRPPSPVLPGRRLWIVSPWMAAAVPEPV